ncbi:MAG: DNA lyase [SAR324 cluster bacterium]|nr:DNA lyase [SAR324 cluster bacterium]
MRLWSFHPKYLDARGLVALWREALLAQKVLAGQTKGYRQHPQLLRFQQYHFPLAAMGSYLNFVQIEAVAREYKFDATKIMEHEEGLTLSVTKGQLLYEWEHLQKKLKRRDLQKYQANLLVDHPLCHPLFHEIAGDIAKWEIISE